MAFLIILLISGCTRQEDLPPPVNEGSITFGDTTAYTGNGITISGTQVLISQGGRYAVTGTTSQGMIQVNTSEEVTLQLEGASITNTGEPAILFENGAKGTLLLSEETNNTLATTSNSSQGAIQSNIPLQIEGPGNLDIASPNEGIYGKDKITLEEGNMAIKAGTEGIRSEGDLVINEGVIKIDSPITGIHTKGILTINGGEIRINADNGYIGGAKIVINNGYLYGDCQKKGLITEDNLTLNGGTVILHTLEESIDLGDEGDTLTLNGGTILTTGKIMDIPVNSASTQSALFLNTEIAEDTLLYIGDTNATTPVVTFRTPVKAPSFFFSSKDLIPSTTFKISTGGSIKGEEKDGLYTSGTYRPGQGLATFTTNAIRIEITKKDLLPQH